MQRLPVIEYCEEVTQKETKRTLSTPDAPTFIAILDVRIHGCCDTENE
jgi:hypothetical protein